MTELYNTSIKRKTKSLIGLLKRGEEFTTACSKSGLSIKKAKNILFYNKVSYKKAI
jgi:hypothetical protein